MLIRHTVASFGVCVCKGRCRGKRPAGEVTRRMDRVNLCKYIYVYMCVCRDLHLRELMHAVFLLSCRVQLVVTFSPSLCLPFVSFPPSICIYCVIYWLGLALAPLYHCRPHGFTYICCMYKYSVLYVHSHRAKQIYMCIFLCVFLLYTYIVINRLLSKK